MKVGGVYTWQLRRRYRVTSAQGRPRRCRDWKVLQIAFSIDIQRAAHMNRERLWKMRANTALNLLSYGTNQVSWGFCLFYWCSLFSFPSEWRTCIFVIESGHWSVIHSGGNFTIHYLKLLIWRTAYCIRRGEVGGWFLDWWLAAEFIPHLFFSLKTQLTCFGKTPPQFLLLNYFR